MFKCRSQTLFEIEFWLLRTQIVNHNNFSNGTTCIRFDLDLIFQGQMVNFITNVQKIAFFAAAS